jgi:hypothetical protein
MTEQPSEFVGVCPSWCRNRGAGGEPVHAHVSDDVVVGDSADPMTARMMLVRVVVGEHVVGVEEAQAFAHAVLRLASSAQLAEPGLGFVEVLAAQADVNTGEMALAAGLDVERVRAQRAGGQVLNAREFDRLALAVAQLLPLRGAVGAAAEEDVTDHQDAGLAGVADMTELAVLAEGPGQD